jgi:hypothetical protein
MTALHRFMRLPADERRAAIEAAMTLAIVCALMPILPFRLLARGIGTVEADDGRAPPPMPTLAPGEVPASREVRAARQVGRALDRASRLLPWHTSCLAHALAGHRMLRRRDLPSTLRLGVVSDAGGLAAHAWLMSGGEPICGTGEAAQFAPIVKFVRRVSGS